MTAAERQLSVDVVVDAAPEVVWDALVDWERQSEWMLATRVRGTHQRGHGVGGGIEATTGVGPFGILDTMVVTEWDPPRRCVVRHTGKLMSGTGTFEVFALPERRSRVVWTEDFVLPLGLLGKLGWPVIRPAVVAGIKSSLKRFAQRVQTDSPRSGA